MEIFMKEIGRMIKQMDTVSIQAPMALNMKVNGKTICDMDLERNNGQMELLMLDFSKKEIRLEEVIKLKK